MGFSRERETPSAATTLTPVDRYLIIDGFNERKKDYPKGLAIHELFEDQARQRPDAVAVTWLDNDITYGELDNAANQLAHHLIKKGIQPDALVGVSVNRSLEMMIAVLGVLKAGAAYLPIDPALPQELLDFMTSDSSAPVIITSSDHADKFATSGRELVRMDDDIEEIMKCSMEKPIVSVNESNLAYVIYTSGSTGRRKAALMEHRSLVNQYYAWQDVYQMSPNDNVLQTASFSFDVFTGDWVTTLCSGGRLILNPFNFLLSQDDYLTGKGVYSIMRDNNVNIAHFTPTVLRKLMKYARTQEEALNFMRLIIVGADAWYMDEHRQFVKDTQRNCRLVDAYGMTEATVDSTYYEGYGAEDDGSGSLIGKPFTNSEIYILDDKNNLVPVGKKGELAIGGLGLARGYLNRPELDAQRFINVGFPDGSTRRLYKSGDLARFRDDGQIEFYGRIDNQVELGSIRVEVGEIEAVIQRHPSIQENSIIVTEDDAHDKVVHCFVVMRAEEDDLRVDLQKFLIDKLPSYMIPSHVHVLSTMPLTSNGKIDRKQLTILAEQADSEKSQ